MKTIITTIALTLALFITKGQTHNAETISTSTITVQVPVKSTEGSINAALYTEDSFMRTPLQVTSSAIEGDQVIISFKNVNPGTYAIVLFHDKNNNNRMDYNVNGMPEEMYGVSNNVMNFGPPNWNDAKFEVTNAPITMEIRL